MGVRRIERFFEARSLSENKWKSFVENSMHQVVLCSLPFDKGLGYVM